MLRGFCFSSHLASGFVLNFAQQDPCITDGLRRTQLGI
jgi:hypothetical protein